MKNIAKILGAATIALGTSQSPILEQKADAHDIIVPGNVVLYGAHVHTRGCAAGPHYIPGEPVRNTLKFLFCPRCHRQYPVGSHCFCMTHVHVAAPPIIYHQPSRVIVNPIPHIIIQQPIIVQPTPVYVQPTPLFVQSPPLIVQPAAAPYTIIVP